MLKPSHSFVALCSALVGMAQVAPFVSVTLDNGTFWGTATESMNKFLGIPFAKAPVGDLRFRLPVASDPYSGSHFATAFGISCPQQIPKIDIPQGFESLTQLFLSIYSSAVAGPGEEDCLTINVWAPSNVPKGAKLPVLAYIYGGGFEDGGTSTYDPTAIVSRSIEMGEPVVFVSMNHRISAFGFLASEEVKAAGLGNIGLQDQREGLRWIQKYISAFNGDPSKVTIWGESSGAISIALQMPANGGNTEGLFHAAFMNSGSPIPVGDITHGQRSYDDLVVATGCQNASDTLQCLREAPYQVLKAAVDATPQILSYQSMNLTWITRADGTFLTDDPQKLVLNGTVANIPFVTGDLDDEGTISSLYSLNLTTDAEAQNYIHSNYFPNATSEQISKLMELYLQDPAQGSPFETGLNNTLTPQYKRLASFQGDFIFQSTRRFFLQHRSDKQDAWSFLIKTGKDVVPLGASHGSDLPQFFDSGGLMMDYLVNFANHFNPNGQNLTNWPKYSPSNPTLLTLLDEPDPYILTNDTFRQEAMEYLTQLTLEYPL